MFKRIRENEKYQKIKELWQNPKTHDIIVLTFWLIFIVALIFFLRLSAPTVTDSKKETSNSNFENMYSYEFSYSDNKQEIYGQAYDDKQEFIWNNKRYYYDKNVYQINGNEAIKQDLDLDILKITPKMLNNLLSHLEGTNNDNYTRYLVPLDRFINLYEIDTDADLTTAMTYNVIADIYKKDNVVNKIVLDLTNYNIFRFKNNQTKVITIYFYNINKVNDFTNEFAKIVGGIK